CFGIHIGLASKGGTFAAQGTKERFSMIGMDGRLCNGTGCLRMFLPWTLIFGALATFFMCLGTFILHPDVYPSFESLLGPSWFAIVHEFMAYLIEQSAIAGSIQNTCQNRSQATLALNSTRKNNKFGMLNC